VMLVAGSPDGQQLVAVRSSGGLVETRNAWRTSRLLAPGVQLRDVAISDEGNVVAAAGSDPGVARWDGHGRLLATLEAPQSLPSRVALTTAIDSRGSRIAAGYYPGGLVVWRSGRAMVLRRRAPPVTALAFAPHGSLLAVGYDSGAIQLRRGKSLQSVLPVVAHATSVRTLAFAPDGHQLASGGSDGAVRLWDVKSGGLLADLVSSGPAVTALAFSADGRSLVATHGAVTVWDTSLWRSDGDAFERVKHHLCSLLVEPGSQAGSPCP
jgi:WD40 repeat protein